MLISESPVSEQLIHFWIPNAELAVRKVLQKLGLTEYFDNKIFINSDYTGSSVSWKDRVTRYAMLNEQRVVANVKFNNNTTNLKWDTTSVQQHMDTMVHRRDTITSPPLFLDPETGINMFTRSLGCNIEIEVTMTFPDSTVAFDVVNGMVSTFNRGELMECINLSYDYPLPVQILKDLWILGQMKGIQKGHFAEWFYKNSNGQIQVIESKRYNNKHHEVVVKQRTYEALMAIDYNPDQPAIETKGSAAETVVIPFNLAVQCSKPNMVYLKYPVVVNNIMVPSELVHVADDELNLNLYKTLHHPERSLDWMYQESMHARDKVVHMPWYDNWVVPRGCQIAENGSKPMLIAVFTFDTDQCKCCHEPVCKCECDKHYTTIDLYEMDGYKLSDKFKAWLLDNKDKALDADSAYSLTVYANDVQITPRTLSFDGRYLKIPNRFMHEAVYRIVFARGKDNPPAYPWLWILDCFIVVDKEM